jgi:hypothetical protein
MDHKAEVKHFQFLTKYAEPKVHYEPEERINRLLSLDSSSAYGAVAESPHLTDEHIEKIMSKPDYYVANHKLAMNPFIKQHHIEKLLDSDDDYIVHGALKNPKITSDLLNKVLGNPHYNNETKLMAATHPNATREQVMSTIRHHNSTMLRRDIIRHSKKLEPDDLHEIVTDDRYGGLVKENAIMHPKVSQKTLQYAAQSQDSMLRKRALETLNLYNELNIQ